MKIPKEQIKKALLDILFVALTLQLVTGLVDATYAHQPEGSVFRAFQFPDHLTPSIDGNLDDWDVVDNSYEIATSQFRDLINPDSDANDSDDFSVRLKVGWNKTANKLYFAAQVRDDIHQVDRPAGSAAVQIFQDDALELFIDADHSGGQYANFSEMSSDDQLQRNGADANHFVIAGPPPDEDFFVNFSAAAWYALTDGPYTSAAFEHIGAIGGAGVVSYEVMLVPFDRVDINAVFQSVKHVMEEGEIIGFNVEFNDFDANSELFDSKWSLSGRLNSFRFSERFADLILMPLESIFQPTVAKTSSWGRLKTSALHSRLGAK